MARETAASKKNPIALQADKFERKIEEFQKYLEVNKISGILDYTERHNEIKVQVLIMEKLGPLLRELKALKIVEEENNGKEIRGDAELSPFEKGLI